MGFRPFARVPLMAAALLAAAAAAAETGPPPAVPDLRDPAVRAQFRLLDLFQLDGDPDFPILVLAGVREPAPPFLVLIVDARNGKETWSLQEDSAVFYLVLSDPTSIRQAYLDEGFAAGGRASGRFTAAGPEGAGNLVTRLRESHGRVRRPPPSLGMRI